MFHRVSVIVNVEFPWNGNRTNYQSSCSLVTMRDIMRPSEQRQLREHAAGALQTGRTVEKR